MKLLGLIGGLSWVSTIDYYRAINQKVAAHLGGVNSAKILLHSLNFDEFAILLRNANYEQMAAMFCRIASGLEQSGAEGIVICANTPHIVADQVQAKINIPLIHIAKVSADRILRQGITKVALLGTRPTMEHPYFSGKLKEKQLEVIVPAKEARQFIHDAVFNELGKGLFFEHTKLKFREIAKDLASRGAEGIILGCTEFPHLFDQDEIPLPLFNTAEIHADAAARYSLNL